MRLTLCLQLSLKTKRNSPFFSRHDTRGGGSGFSTHRVTSPPPTAESSGDCLRSFVFTCRELY